MIHLLIREVNDLYSQENFKRLKDYLNDPNSPLNLAITEANNTVVTGAAKLIFTGGGKRKECTHIYVFSTPIHVLSSKHITVYQ